MLTITKKQLICVNTLVSKLKIGKDDKEVLVSGFSDGRTRTSKELKEDEALELIRHLRSFDPRGQQETAMKNKILAMAHEMGWNRTDGKIDMISVNQWCVKRGYLKKELDKHTYQELPALVTQFEKAYADFIKRA